MDNMKIIKEDKDLDIKLTDIRGVNREGYRYGIITSSPYLPSYGHSLFWDYADAEFNYNLLLEYLSEQTKDKE